MFVKTENVRDEDRPCIGIYSKKGAKSIFMMYYPDSKIKISKYESGSWHILDRIPFEISISEVEGLVEELKNIMDESKN